MTKTALTTLPAWTPTIILKILHGKAAAEQPASNTRETLRGVIDGRGFSLTESATLHALDNTETLKTAFNQLVAPRPSERSNLEKIISLLEAIAKTAEKNSKNQVALAERMAEIELQIVGLSDALTKWRSP
ncbi:MAG: hypothetical protein B7X08_03075 [Acidocella sp. 20-63-7]|nr:MAG: hypothetical protein B7X08_03075 [Acidocella sp. 20-63-7]